jgi:Uma2 family endonuclease
MSTILRFGPLDHGRLVREEDLAGARYQEGYRYEIIEGRLYVSPAANMPHDLLVARIRDRLFVYAQHHLEVINHLAVDARVFVPNRPDLTAPEPDIAAYQDLPLDLPTAQFRWEDHTPILVVEVVSEEDSDKDLVRNVGLYRLVPGIREYWIIDPRPDPDQPTLTVYRRRGRRWQAPLHVPFGGVYTTRLLPDFQLIVDPRA